jgi:hypothetical protein
MAAKPKASLALVDADAAPAGDLSTLRLRPSERRPKVEAAPDAALENRAPGADMFFQKGDASASTFRPSYWTYERHPEAEAPRPPASEPTPAAAQSVTRPAKRPLAPPPPAPVASPVASLVVAKAPAPAALVDSPVATKPANAPVVVGAAVAPMASLSNLGFMGKNKAARVASVEAAKVAEMLLAREATLKENDFEEVDPPLETTASYLPAPAEAEPSPAQTAPQPAVAAPAATSPKPAQPKAKTPSPAVPEKSATPAAAPPEAVLAALKARPKAEAPVVSQKSAPELPEVAPPVSTTSMASYLPAPAEAEPSPAPTAPQPTVAAPAATSPKPAQLKAKTPSPAVPEKSATPAAAPPEAVLAALKARPKAAAPVVPEKSAPELPDVAPPVSTTTIEVTAVEARKPRAAAAAPLLEPGLAEPSRGNKLPPAVATGNAAAPKQAPSPGTSATRKPVLDVPPRATPPASRADIAVPVAAEGIVIAAPADKSQTQIARSVIREMRDRFRRSEPQPELPEPEAELAALETPAVDVTPIVPSDVVAPAPAPSQAVADERPVDVEPPVAHRPRSATLPALPVQPAAVLAQQQVEPEPPAAMPVARVQIAPKPAAPVILDPSALALEIEIDAAAEERRVAAEIADTLGAAIESVLASKWYGTGEWQGEPPPAPTASERAPLAPTITHEALMAELATARLASRPTRPAERSNRGVAAVCVLMLALATFFGLSLWRNHADPVVPSTSISSPHR